MDGHIKIPTYRSVGIWEIDGNPLAAHLPMAPETDDEAFLALARKPEFNVSERELSNAIRRLLIMRLKDFFVPVMPVHREALCAISTNIQNGYVERNPMTANGQRILHGYGVNLHSKPPIMMITGYSGMGKSTLIDRILSYYKGQVWQHTNYKGNPISETQIIWLRGNIPEQCTVNSLCRKFGEYTDSALGQNLYSGIFSARQRASSDQLLTEIRKIISTHHVGVLILDEFQNLSLMGLGAKKIIALLVNLRDELGLPIVLIGTHKVRHLMQLDLSVSRRLAEGGYFELEKPASSNDQTWQELCMTAWEYQWVRKPIKYSESIGAALYDVSQGITGIMLTALVHAQDAAIVNGSERVDENLLRQVYDGKMKQLFPELDILKMENRFMQEQSEDMSRNYKPTTQIDPSEKPWQDKISHNSEKEPDADSSKTINAEEKTDTSKNVNNQHPKKTTKINRPTISKEKIERLILEESHAEGKELFAE